MLDNDTIVALATPDSTSAISVIRITGENSISIVENLFVSVVKGKKLSNQSTHTIHLGFFKNHKLCNKYLDQVLISIFVKPYSYTGENMIEISCHGSYYIRNNILHTLIDNGMRLAKPGEFTLRAFINKKLDLIQVEAISDLIISENESIHDISLQQVNGNLTNIIKSINNKLLNIASILEFILDFAEENLSTINHNMLKDICLIKKDIKELIESFYLGNALKKGIKVIIIGETNVGKSTFFNTIMKEEKSIVSPMKGTTRDIIEGNIIINGILFRFLDTAGIRNSKNSVEKIGINKTIKEIKNSQVIFYILHYNKLKNKKIIKKIIKFYAEYPNKYIFVIINKFNKNSDSLSLKDMYRKFEFIFEISANNINEIRKILYSLSDIFIKKKQKKKIIITHIRHYEIMKNSLKEIIKIENLIRNKFSEDIIAIHVKNVLHLLGKITGTFNDQNILDNIFSKFCIGK